MKIFGFDFSNLSYDPKENLEHNRRFLRGYDRKAPRSGFSEDGFIENQARLPEIKYSARDFAYCGCGCIAYWNILHSRGKNPPIAKLASQMEKGCFIRGVFGTNGFFLKRFMEKQGEKVEVAFNPKDLGDFSEGIILYYRLPRVGHYVAFTYEGDNEKGQRLYRFYNAGGRTMRRFGEGNPAVMTLEEYIKETAYNFSIYYKLN